MFLFLIFFWLKILLTSCWIGNLSSSGKCLIPFSTSDMMSNLGTFLRVTENFIPFLSIFSCSLVNCLDEMFTSLFESKLSEFCSISIVGKEVGRTLWVSFLCRFSNFLI
uniref:Secreted protein n=1 Tax=Cacopsylla melanoneura TaxID=428564 RepID=A0A8D8T9S3_9HEMI